MLFVNNISVITQLQNAVDMVYLLVVA